jgi:predicted GNAT superfamily acetyltransferase
LAVIRNASEHDFDAILRLNRESEAFLSPLSRSRLTALHGQAWHHRVACRDGVVDAFLLALRPGCDYDSPNYRWFAQRYTDFVYIDRVVVRSSARSAGLATLLYEELFRRAAESGISRVTCEFDCEPPNDASRKFHTRLGFVEVGTQRVGPTQKAVSLQELRLPT